MDLLLCGCGGFRSCSTRFQHNPTDALRIVAFNNRIVHYGNGIKLVEGDGLIAAAAQAWLCLRTSSRPARACGATPRSRRSLATSTTG